MIVTCFRNAWHGRQAHARHAHAAHMRHARTGRLAVTMTDVIALI